MLERSVSRLNCGRTKDFLMTLLSLTHICNFSRSVSTLSVVSRNWLFSCSSYHISRFQVVCRSLWELMISLGEYFLALSLLIILLTEWNVLLNAKFGNSWVFLLRRLGTRNGDKYRLVWHEVLVEIYVRLIRHGHHFLHFFIASHFMSCLLSSNASTYAKANLSELSLLARLILIHCILCFLVTMMFRVNLTQSVLTSNLPDCLAWPGQRTHHCVQIRWLVWVHEILLHYLNILPFEELVRSCLAVWERLGMVLRWQNTLRFDNLLGVVSCHGLLLVNVTCLLDLWKLQAVWLSTTSWVFLRNADMGLVDHFSFGEHELCPRLWW